MAPNEREFLDPAVNYTQPENQPVGARVPEFVFRQLIGSTLEKAAIEASNPSSFLDELFAMWGSETIRQVKGFFRDHPNVPVTVNWPNQDLAFPYVSVVNQGEREDVAFMGDHLGTMRYGVFGGKPTVREQRGVVEAHETDVIVAASDPNLAMYMHHVVKYAFFVNKLALTEHYDIQNLVISGRDLAFDASFFPTFGYFKTVHLSFQTTFDFNLSEESALILNVGLKVEALKDGVPAVTDVPGEEGP